MRPSPQLGADRPLCPTIREVPVPCPFTTVAQRRRALWSRVVAVQGQIAVKSLKTSQNAAPPSGDSSPRWVLGRVPARVADSSGPPTRLDCWSVLAPGAGSNPRRRRCSVSWPANGPVRDGRAPTTGDARCRRELLEPHTPTASAVSRPRRCRGPCPIHTRITLCASGS